MIVLVYVLGLVSLFEFMLLMIAFPLLKEKFLAAQQNRGYNKIIRIFRDGRIDISFEKLSKDGLRFYKNAKNTKDKDTIVIDKPPFRDTKTGARTYILVEGEASVYDPFLHVDVSKNSKLVQDAMIDAFEAGKDYAQSLYEQDQKQTAKLVMLSILILLGVAIAAYFGYQAYQLLKTMQPILQSLKPQIVTTVK